MIDVENQPPGDWIIPANGVVTRRNREEWIGSGVQYVVWFPNGYAASLVCGPWTYGGDAGLWELAVVISDEMVPNDPWRFGMCYDTPVTDDVIGHLTSTDVNHLLQQIATLPPKVDHE